MLRSSCLLDFLLVATSGVDRDLVVGLRRSCLAQLLVRVCGVGGLMKFYRVWSVETMILHGCSLGVCAFDHEGVGAFLHLIAFSFPVDLDLTPFH